MRRHYPPEDREIFQQSATTFIEQETPVLGVQ